MLILQHLVELEIIMILKSLMNLDLYGVIIGKALYSGNIDLKKAINLCN